MRKTGPTRPSPRTSGARRRGPRRAPRLTARTADKHRLYELAVQEPSAEIDFVDATYRRLRGRPAGVLREDFCGTAATCCEWVTRRAGNRAIGLDLHAPTLRWGLRNNVAALPEEARARVRLLRMDVRAPGPEARGVDIVSAMNFSYSCLDSRAELGAYFRSVRESLAPGGVFFMDYFGGYECMKEQVERRRIRAGRHGRFTYIWDQHRYEPLSGRMTNKIHFEFEDGTRIRDAFTYRWRLWTMPELRELLEDAGFRGVTVYLEGDDGKGSGNGVFRPRRRGEADACFLAYISAPV